MLETFTQDEITSKKCKESKVKVFNERMENLESLSRNLNNRVLEIANALNSGNYNSSYNKERPILEKFRSKYGRSISEYPEREEPSVKQRGAFLSPKSLIYLPHRFTSQQDFHRRTSAASSTSGLYPNFNRERQPVVRRAAHNFRKGSLSSKSKDNLKNTFRKSISLAEESLSVEEVWIHTYLLKNSVS